MSRKKERKKGLSKGVKGGFVFLGEGGAASSCSLCVTSFCFEEITVGFLSCSVFILNSFCLHKVVDPCWVMDLKDFINEIFFNS